MGVKKVNGDLNVTGTIMKNGTALPTQSGTKLYKHHITGGMYDMTLISTYSSPLNFNTLDTYDKIHNFLGTIPVLEFKVSDGGGVPVIWLHEDHCFCATYIDSTGQFNVENGRLDDWVIDSSIDTVTQL